MSKVIERKRVPLDQEFLIQGGCPMCETGSLLVQFESWEECYEEIGQGLMKGMDLTRVECSNEVDLDDPEWDDFQSWHNDMPYVNWLPRITLIEELLNKMYMFDESIKESEPIILTLCLPVEANLKIQNKLEYSKQNINRNLVN